MPAQNILILTCEEADRRQRLFAAIKKHGLVVDCAVTEGAGTAAQGEQKDILREMMLKTLKEFGKKIEPQALDMFFERVGFHPVAVVMETEKLALHAGDRTLITIADLDEMVGRSREDALFEMTDAFAKGQAARTLTILNRLQDSGTHALAILSTMRNYLRRLMIFRSLQLRPEPHWHSTMNARQFQNDYLPALKASGEWPELLKGHPYALFMSFTAASGYSCRTLRTLAGPAPCGRISPQGFAPAPASRPRGTLPHHAAGQTPRTKEPLNGPARQPGTSFCIENVSIVIMIH